MHVAMTASDYTSRTLKSVGCRKDLLYQGFQPVSSCFTDYVSFENQADLWRRSRDIWHECVTAHNRTVVLMPYKIPMQTMRAFPPLELTKAFGKENTAKDTTEEDKTCSSQTNHSFD